MTLPHEHREHNHSPQKPKLASLPQLYPNLSSAILLQPHCHSFSLRVFLPSHSINPHLKKKAQIAINWFFYSCPYSCLHFSLLRNNTFHAFKTNYHCWSNISPHCCSAILKTVKNKYQTALDRHNTPRTKHGKHSWTRETSNFVSIFYHTQAGDRILSVHHFQSKTDSHVWL